MKIRKSLCILAFFIGVLPVSGESQYSWIQLETDAAITGMGFYNLSHGIITTGDSLVFLVRDGFHVQPELTPVNVLDDTFPSYASTISSPAWINDSTVFIQTVEGIGGDRYIKMSQDSGKTWEAVQHLGGLGFYGNPHPVGDTLLAYPIIHDALGNIRIQVLNSRGELIVDKDFYGQFAQEFVPVNRDTILFATYSDSLALYSLSADQTWKIHPEIPSTPQHPLLFTELESDSFGVVLGVRPGTPDSLFRSVDGGYTWEFVRDGENFEHLIYHRGYWWVSTSSEGNLTILQSRDNGERFSYVAEIPEGEIFAPSDRIQYWFGSDSGRVNYGIYNPNSVDDFLEIPASFRVSAYPNPFNSTVQFRITDLAPGQHYSVTIYNLLGEQVATLFTGVPEATTLQLEWQPDYESSSSGIYFLRVQTGHTIKTRKISLIR